MEHSSFEELDMALVYGQTLFVQNDCLNFKRKGLYLMNRGRLLDVLCHT